MSRVPGTRWRHYATALTLTGMLLAGCSGQPTAAKSSVTSCYLFAASAIQHQVTVTAVPAACQGLSQVQVNVAVGRALRAAVAGVSGKVRQRQVIVRDISYLAGLIHAIPASSPPAVTAPQSRPPGQTAVATPPSRPPSRAALSLATLIAWLITVGLGASMMARWITRTRRPGTQPRRGRGPVLNFAHLGLALTGLLAWISYLATGVSGLAWAACGLLLAVASLGMTLVFLPRPPPRPPPGSGMTRRRSVIRRSRSSRRTSPPPASPSCSPPSPPSAPVNSPAPGGRRPGGCRPPRMPPAAGGAPVQRAASSDARASPRAGERNW